jgi:2-isopropylmalate synthase
VGNQTRIVLSELAGKGTVLSKAEEHDALVEKGDEEAILTHVKEQEAKGFSFEAADASVSLLFKRREKGYAPPFRLLDYKVIVGRREAGETYAEATVKLEVGNSVHHTAAEGNGPVSALDAATRKALAATYPEASKFHLVDYKVRILDGKDGTSATTRVLIDSTDGERRWTTVGASSNIIEASWFALADSIEFGLLSLRSTPSPSAP